jgi:hypothetical protein
MHSSHHSKGDGVRRQGERDKAYLKHLWPRIVEVTGGYVQLPPSSSTQAIGIHLAHIAHADDANGGIFLGATHSGLYFLRSVSQLVLVIQA